MQRAREVFYLYALQNALTIALAIVLGRHSIAGLTSSISIAYTVGAVVALATLARHQVSIAPVIWSVHVRRSLWASLGAAITMALTYAASGATRGAGLVARFSTAAVAGLLVYALLVLVSQWRLARRSGKGARLRSF